MIRASSVTILGTRISGSSQSAHQADGSSPLTVIGEARLTFTRDSHDLLFEGLVVENIDTEILAGIPFIEKNDVSIRPSRRGVILGDNHVYTYGSSPQQSTAHTIRRAHIVRAPSPSTTLWPSDLVEIDLPSEMLSSVNTFSVEPRIVTDQSMSWPEPCLVSSVSGKLCIPNLTSAPRMLKRNEHFCKVRCTFVPKVPTCTQAESIPMPTPQSSEFHSDTVRVDPETLLSEEIRFKDIYANMTVFSIYNGASGPLDAKVNMGPIQPPQREDRVPQYSKDQLVTLQEKFDELESIGVFCTTRRDRDNI